jgi:hypothetical protein
MTGYSKLNFVRLNLAEVLDGFDICCDQPANERDANVFELRHVERRVVPNLCTEASREHQGIASTD